MQWGIVFKLPASYESHIWEFPIPSNIRRLSSSNGKDMVVISYHFLHAPQSKQEWQRLASIKVQIAHRIKHVSFDVYELNEINGKVYTISELGSYFQAFVKFPQPQFPNGQTESYRMLCRHAKRLHYENKLHLEQLIFVSFWFNDINNNREGPHQTTRRAIAAYKFAQEHKYAWKAKLTSEELVIAHRKGATRTNDVKKGVAILHSHIAKFMAENKHDLDTICSVLSISKRTYYNYKRLLTP